MKKNTVIKVIKRSPIETDAECIVNATNHAMRNGGGGMNAIIHKFAGHKLLQALKSKVPNGVETAEPVITSGYNLCHKYIIHVAGPIYGFSDHSISNAQLFAAYVNCLALAAKHNIKSIAFCSISTGTYKYPVHRAAVVARQAVEHFLLHSPNTTLRKIQFCLNKKSEFDEFEKEFKNIFDDNSLMTKLKKFLLKKVHIKIGLVD